MNDVDAQAPHPGATWTYTAQCLLCSAEVQIHPLYDPYHPLNSKISNMDVGCSHECLPDDPPEFMNKNNNNHENNDNE